MSTKYALFFLLDNREPPLQTDIKFDLVDVKEKHSEELSDKVTFDAVLSTAISMGEKCIKLLMKTQAKQQLDYSRHH